MLPKITHRDVIRSLGTDITHTLDTVGAPVARAARQARTVFSEECAKEPLLTSMTKGFANGILTPWISYTLLRKLRDYKPNTDAQATASFFGYVPGLAAELVGGASVMAYSDHKPETVLLLAGALAVTNVASYVYERRRHNLIADAEDLYVREQAVRPLGRGMEST